ncbi:hypothetical protein J4E89_010121 [Alternaria sp. Ai002NY15]|nr:hypothetical protein J4E89_010121 [Alternaria sp. Ai002NY15]
MRDADIVGHAIAEVLPQTNKYWFQIPHLRRLNLILLVPLLSSAVAGYDGSLMNGLQSLPQWQEYFGHPTGALLGLVNAAQSAGSVVVLPFVGVLSDRYGRRIVLFSGLIGVIIATIIQATATTLAQFVVSRAVVGAAGMFVVQPSPMLIAELAYPTHRGKYTSAFWTMYYLESYTSVNTVFRWLVAKERQDEARQILARYHSGGDEHSPLVTREMSEIVYAIRQESAAKSVQWSALVATPGNRKRLFLAVCVGGFAQWNGIGVVSYYLTLVLNSIGITDPFMQTLINGLLQIFNFAAAVSAALLVDRLGRRTLFLWSGIGMLISYIVWTACSAVNNEDNNKAAGYVVVVCLFVFYFHYDIAYTPLLMSYPTEIFTYSLRSKGVSCELLSIYVSLVIQAFVNPVGMENLGWKYYIVFCCLLVVFLGVTYFFFPETKGRSLEEIAEIFDGPGASPDADLVAKEEKFDKQHIEVAGVC